MFKNTVTRHVTCECFKLQTAAVKRLDFFNEKNMKGHREKTMINIVDL